MMPSTGDISDFPLALGTWTFAGDKIWGASEEEHCIRVVHYALERGIRLFDTSPNYGDGRSEEILGKAVHDRPEAQIATKLKIDDLSDSQIRSLVHGSLKRLKRDRIDLLQIHWPAEDPDVTKRALEVFNELKHDEIVKEIGVCNFGVFDLAETAELGIVSNQIPYGLLWRVVEAEIIKASRMNGCRILGYGTLQQGLLSGRYKCLADFPVGRKRTRHFTSPDERLYELTDTTLRNLHSYASSRGLPLPQIALAFSLSRDFIDTVIIGSRSTEQLEQILEAGNLHLSAEDIKRLDDMTVNLKDQLGGNPDMFKEESRVRYSSRNGDPI